MKRLLTLVERQQKRLEEFRLKQEDKKRKLKLKKKKKKKKTVKKEELVKEITPKKKKVGRPKKRGPKKKRIRKKIVKIYKERPVINFKIVSVLNGKQNGYIGSYRTYTEAYEELMKLERSNKDIVFPRKFINKGTIDSIKEEYLLLEKNRFGDKSDGMLRNEYGKYVEQKIINNSNWIVRDKCSRLTEETFWVYGYDPKKDRKTYNWIYEHLIIGSIEEPYDIIRISIYKNKLLIKYDNKPMSMVLCKNKSDSIRMYNLISEKVRNEKKRQILCLGAYNSVCDARREIEKEIMELTGWNKVKIQRATN